MTQTTFMPSSEACYEVARVFDGFSRRIGYELNMNDGDVRRSHDYDHPCKTVACHGGFWALHEIEALRGYKKVKKVLDKYTAEESVSLCDPFDLLHELGFSTGSEQLAQFLGFVYRDDLEDWASKNPLIWGTCTGGGMFYVMRAFSRKCPREGGFRNQLDRIGCHWKAVGDRVKALENNNEQPG